MQVLPPRLNRRIRWRVLARLPTTITAGGPTGRRLQHDDVLAVAGHDRSGHRRVTVHTPADAGRRPRGGRPEQRVRHLQLPQAVVADVGQHLHGQVLVDVRPAEQAHHRADVHGAVVAARAALARRVADARGGYRPAVRAVRVLRRRELEELADRGHAAGVAAQLARHLHEELRGRHAHALDDRQRLLHGGVVEVIVALRRLQVPSESHDRVCIRRPPRQRRAATTHQRKPTPLRQRGYHPRPESFTATTTTATTTATATATTPEFTLISQYTDLQNGCAGQLQRCNASQPCQRHSAGHPQVLAAQRRDVGQGLRGENIQRSVGTRHRRPHLWPAAQTHTRRVST